MIMGFSVADWGSAVIIVSTIAGAAMGLVKMFIRQELKEPKENMIEIKGSLLAINNSLHTMNARMTRLEELPDRVTRIEVDLYKALATTATIEALDKQEERCSLSIQRIHERIDRWEAGNVA